MKNKFIFCLLTFAICMFLVGCGNGKKLDDTTTTKKSGNNSNEINANVRDNDIVADDDILDIDDSDNVPGGEQTVTVDEVINCPGCVFAYFDAEGDKAKTLGSKVTPDEYTNDVTKLKTKGGKQRHNFFGLVLSGNTISKAYACILKDNKIICIQGSTDGAHHTNNISILNKIFTGKQCRTISDGHTYTCTDGSYNGDSKTNGYTSLHYETSCVIYGADSNTGKLICH